MRGRKVVTSVMALGLSLSGQVLAQGAPPPAPAPAKPAPAPAPAPPVAPAPGAVAPTPAAPPAIAPAPAPAPPPGPAPVAPPGPMPTPPDAAQPPPPPPEPAPAPLPPPAVLDPEPPASVDPEPDLPAPESYSEGGDSWYDLIQFSAFVDAYASVNYNFPKPQTGKNRLRAHDTTNGFSLAWVGVNASYPADPVGGTISLRFGPAAREVAACVARADAAASGTPQSAPCDDEVGLDNVKQGFVSWKPGGADSAITLDLGKFDTPFGVEVAESYLNLNYTRSMLYLSQPVTHTGLRANFEVAEAFDFRVIAVNGWNNSIDNNVGKSLGVQGTFHVRNSDGSDIFTASLGYMGGPEHDDVQTIDCEPGTRFEASSATGCVATMAAAGTVATSGLVDRASSNTKGLRHLIDLVVTADPIERLRLVLNADFGRDSVRSAESPSEFDGTNYYGVLLGARLAVVDAFGVAARGEFFHDSNGYISGFAGEEMNLVGGTLTLELLPADFLTLRLDNRLDWASKQIFDKELREHGGYQFTTTLGVVGHTN